MSGGQWDYIQNDMVHIAGDLELECGRKPWNPATQAQIVDAIVAIRLAAIYVERIDWLLSGDDDEGSFHARLMEQLAERKEIRKEVIKQVQRSARKWKKEERS